MKQKEKNNEQEIEKDCDCCHTEKCDCDENETKNHTCDCNKNDDLDNNCHCGDECECGDECNCKDGCDCCDDECDCCDDDCDCCDDDCDCGCHEISEQAAEYLELAQKIQAEFDNYRKRNQEAIKDAEARGIMKAVTKLLPIVDSITSAKRQIEDEKFKNSIEVLYNQVIQLLQGLNVTKIQAKGLEFDPHKHNAVLTEEVEGVEPGIVIEELQEGFVLGDKVIRHSVVKVSK